MKVITKETSGLKRGAAATKKDEAALSERVCLSVLDKHANTLRVQRGVNLYVSMSQMQRSIKRAIDCKFATSEEAKEANTAITPI